MKQLTQDVFTTSKHRAKSAVVTPDGKAWLFECKKDNLTPTDKSWTCDIDTAFYFLGYGYDATNWQNSAIDRGVIEVKPGYTCGDCGYHHEPHQLRTTFCEGCDTLLS